MKRGPQHEQAVLRRALGATRSGALHAAGLEVERASLRRVGSTGRIAVGCRVVVNEVDVRRRAVLDIAPTAGHFQPGPSAANHGLRMQAGTAERIRRAVTSTFADRARRPWLCAEVVGVRRRWLWISTLLGRDHQILVVAGVEVFASQCRLGIAGLDLIACDDGRERATASKRSRFRMREREEEIVICMSILLCVRPRYGNTRCNAITSLLRGRSQSR